MKPYRAAVLNFSTCLFFLLAATPLRAEDQPCKDHNITIESSSPEEKAWACAALSHSTRFLKRIGLAFPDNLVIMLVDGHRSQTLSKDEIGRFNARSNIIQIRSYQAFHSLAQPLALDLPKSLETWQSYIVHEVSHAAVHAGCDETCPSRAMHEYVAAVAQIDALPGQLRASLLERYRGLPAFGALSEISYLYYEMNPGYFAVKAYKHFQNLTDPQGFVRDVLHLQ